MTDFCAICYYILYVVMILLSITRYIVCFVILYKIGDLKMKKFDKNAYNTAYNSDSYYKGLQVLY